MQNGPLDDLAAHAHDARVTVVGGGIGGLVAALACAKIGIRVTLIEAYDRLGGAVWTHEVAGLAVDLGAEGYATRGGTVRALIEELGLTAAVVPPAPRTVWISGIPGGAQPLPDGTIRGIPENPWDERIRRFIGWRGAWRAYIDRIRPPLTIGQERSLGRLVRTRMGELVLERLVAPLSLGAFSIHPDDVDVEAVAPGLSAALTRTGSLSGGVSQLRAASAGASAAAGLEGIEGGMSRVIAALHDRLVELGAEVVVGSAVTALERGGNGRWSVITAEGGLGVDPADHVIVATGAADAHRLLTAAVPALEPTPVTALEVVTLVVDAPELDAEPDRTEVYPVSGSSAAASLTDSTARWPWLRRAAGPGAHVLKVTFGGPGAEPATAPLDDAGAESLAVAEASALRGVTIDPGRVRGSHRARYEQPPPVSAIGHRESAEAAREAIHAVPGLAVVGAWVAGTGIAQVVPDALEEAERVRRTVLWGSPDERV
ncbi:oxygen-dependent protoporphyrinogen oxidase [Microbacterium sp. cf046]|uniref:protoporphyrinogen oxidase n=1 Tax=Microbacterium sp. cf046 TaxID=1761803 RepID=UPI0008EA858B|nr:protoporphyrinogen oxidase [Microbacterium sp. cf046]SFS13281.1 oxygen-dependent protoporphyrinogen oxidase [Microbacterium sp. cf046]